MYCPSCGKQIEDDAKFCPHCGKDVDATDDAPQQQSAGAVPPPPAPVPPTPQPSGVTPPPTAIPAAAPPSTPPSYQPTTAPAMGVPPASAAGQPAKKGSSCWLIGCIVLAVLVLLGGVGGYFGWKYLRAKGGEVIQDIQGQLDQGGSGDLTINEGGSGGSDSGGTPDTGGGGTISSEAPAEAVAVVQEMFRAWARGDVGGVTSQMTATLRDALSGDDSPFATKYEQISVEFTNEEKISNTQWTFTIEETYRASSGDDAQVTVYEVEVTDQGGSAGWKVSDMDKIEDR